MEAALQWVSEEVEEEKYSLRIWLGSAHNNEQRHQAREIFNVHLKTVGLVQFQCPGFLYKYQDIWDAWQENRTMKESDEADALKDMREDGDRIKHLRVHQTQEDLDELEGFWFTKCRTPAQCNQIRKLMNEQRRVVGAKLRSKVVELIDPLEYDEEIIVHESGEIHTDQERIARERIMEEIDSRIPQHEPNGVRAPGRVPVCTAFVVLCAFAIVMI